MTAEDVSGWLLALLMQLPPEVRPLFGGLARSASAHMALWTPTAAVALVCVLLLSLMFWHDIHVQT